MLQPDPIPTEVRELFDYLMTYAATGNLGVISVFDKDTFQTRFALFGRHSTGQLVPLGFLSTTAGDEVIPPGAEPRLIEMVIASECDEERRAYGTDSPEDIDRWADDGGPHG